MTLSTLSVVWTPVKPVGLSGRPVSWLKFSSSGLPFLFLFLFLFFIRHLLDVFDIGFYSFGSFALSFLWVSPSISNCFSASILAPPHEIVGGC
jgi:hypothetical protein